MTDFQQIPILNILPQRPPFVFVDRLLHYDEELTRTAYRIPEDALFVEDGHFRSAGLVEHMAQSAAARTGYVARYILHIPVTIGYIGSVRKLRILRHPRVGETLETSVFVRQDIFGITLTDIEVRCGDELLATASMKTATSDKEIAE
ncbi:MAG: pseudouridylate synthase [Bacteroidales bacterium]|nr:pseudouridylate synthase [Bacteroidales bacterium]